MTEKVATSLLVECELVTLTKKRVEARLRVNDGRANEANRKPSWEYMVELQLGQASCLSRVDMQLDRVSCLSKKDMHWPAMAK